MLGQRQTRLAEVGAWMALHTNHCAHRNGRTYTPYMDNKVIGVAVGSAIDASGQSRASMARSVHMDPAALSRSISGERAFKSVELAWIASELGISVDELMGREVLPFMAAARATSTADAHVDTELRAIASTMFERRRGLHQLGIGARAQLPRLPERATDEQIAAAIVERLREVAGDFVLAEIDELATAFEDAFGVDVWVQPLPQGIDGYSVHAPADDVYGIIATSTVPAQRIRFTIAHELAHLILGDDTTNAPHRIDVHDFVDDPIEKRANRIAGAVLIPQHKIIRRDKWTATQVETEAFRFRVAPTAFATRVRAHLYQGDLKSLPAVWSPAFVGEQSHDAWQTRSRKARPPKRLLRDLALAYVNGASTVRPFALVAGIDDLETARANAQELASTASAA